MPMKARYTTIDGEIVSRYREGACPGLFPDPSTNTADPTEENQSIAVRLEYPTYEERTGAGPSPVQFLFCGAVGYSSDTAQRLYVRARTSLARVDRGQ